MVAPIHSTKHYLEQTLGNIGPGLLTSLNIVTAVAVVDKNISNEVEEGATIKAVYVEMWITSDDVTQSSFTITLEKIPAGAGAMTYAESITLQSYPNKKNIFYKTMGLVAPKLEPPLPIIRQWFKIPKGKQRFGLGDTLRLNISGITDGINFCGFYTYKEYQ